MRACPSCGHENADDVDFCANCGQYIRWEPTRLARAVEAPPAEAPAPAPPAPAAPAQPPAPAQPGVPAQPAAPAQPVAPPAAPQAAPAAQAVAPAQPVPAAPAAAQPAPQPVEPAAPVQPPPASPPAPVAEPPAEEGKGGGFRGRFRKKQKAEPEGPPAEETSAPDATDAAAAQPAEQPAQPSLPAQLPRTPPTAPPPIPKSPAQAAGFLSKFKLGSKGAAPAAEGDQAGAAAGQPLPEYQTWLWPSLEQEQKSSFGKVLFMLFLLLLVLGAAAAGVWYFVLREEDKAATPKKAAAAAAADSPLEALVIDLDRLLRVSAKDRTKIKAAIVGAEKNCSVPPGRAAATVGEVTKSRQGVLKEVKALKPPDAESRRLVQLFAQSLTLSLSANQGYTKWLNDLKGSPAACKNPEANANYQAAQGVNAQTQEAKKAFVTAYNPLAKRFGKRTWTSLQI